MGKRSHDAAAVITGAGSGIGAAFAVELAARGGRVVCSDIDELAAQRTVDAITDQGGDAVALRCDVSRLEDVQELARRSQAWFQGPPTLVINNAGVGAGGTPIGETSLQDWVWTVGINLWGPIHGCHVFAPILRDADSSEISRAASSTSPRPRHSAPRPAWRAYNVSKAGVLSLSETLAAELSGTRNQRHGVVPDLRQDQHPPCRRRSPGDLRGSRRDLADRLMRWTGCLGRARGPGTCLRRPRPRRSLLHAATRRQDRLGHQTLRPHHVHPDGGPTPDSPSALQPVTSPDQSTLDQ